MKGTWKFSLEDGSHTLAAQVSTSLRHNTLTVHVDGALTHEAHFIWFVGEITRFKWNLHDVRLKAQGLGIFGRLVLVIDGQEIPEGISSRPPAAPSNRQATLVPQVKVHLFDEYELKQARIEEVNVPMGVKVTVKRSRSIEHNVSFEFHTTKEANFDVGFRQIVNLSVRGEIEQIEGRSYQESENIEYEVSLDGGVSTRYQMIWVDVWRKGIAEVANAETLQIPFLFLERTELQIKPLR